MFANTPINEYIQVNCKKHIKLHGRDEAEERARSKYQDTEPYDKIETTVIIDDSTVTTLHPGYEIEFSKISLPNQDAEKVRSINDAAGSDELGVGRMDTSDCLFPVPGTEQGSIEMVGYESSVETMTIPLNSNILEHAVRAEEKEEEDLFPHDGEVRIHRTNINPSQQRLLYTSINGFL